MPPANGSADRAWLVSAAGLWCSMCLAFVAVATLISRFGGPAVVAIESMNNLERGGLYDAAGQTVEAIGVYSRHLSFDPGNHAMRERLVASLLDAGEVEDALTEATRLLRQDPRALTPATWTLYGDASRLSGNADDAVLAYTRALEFEPGPAGAHYGMARLLGGAGNYEGMFAALEKLAAAGVGNAQPEFARRVARARDVMEAHGAAPGKPAPETWDQLAEAHLLLGNVSGAISVIDRSGAHLDPELLRELEGLRDVVRGTP